MYEDDYYVNKKPRKSKFVLWVVTGVVGLVALIAGLSQISSGDNGYKVPDSGPPAGIKTHAEPNTGASANPDIIREGVWEVGTDVKPGKYRTIEEVKPEDMCYWQIAKDEAQDNIVGNDLPTGGKPTVTLKKGQYFKTQGCGNWARARG